MWRGFRDTTLSVSGVSFEGRSYVVEELLLGLDATVTVVLVK
ncbi:hypothetical protein [Deinococcus pimensis]|nr:hypothetical protein [Deinococcus pimensis]